MCSNVTCLLKTGSIAVNFGWVRLWPLVLSLYLLIIQEELPMQKERPVYLDIQKIRLPIPGLVSIFHRFSGIALFIRSEERRVGKECRYGWAQDH